VNLRASRGRIVTLSALLLVTVLWGWTFVWMKQCLDAASRVLGRDGGSALVSFYVAVRFGAAAVVLGAWPAARSGLDSGTWRAGAVLGGLLFSGFALQMRGLAGITPAVSAFLTSLYVVFAAIFTAILHRARPKTSLILGVLLATFGAGFIEGPPHLTFGAAEWMSVGCAFIFAFHILATDRLTRAHPPLGVTLTSFVITAVLAAGALAIALTLPGAVTREALWLLLLDRGYWVPLALATFFSTIVALTLMNFFQRLLDPVRAAILFALEPIWTTVIAAALGYGSPSTWLLVGGGALLAGNVVAELGAMMGGGEDHGHGTAASSPAAP
jgi:drug/metabolite transporter (DMT)-like permease